MINPNTELIDNVGRVATTDDLKSREELLIELQFMRVSASRLAADLVSCQDIRKASQAELAKYKADAERYQWLKSRKNLRLETSCMLWTTTDGTPFTESHCLADGDTQHAPGVDLDETIDAAMKAKP